MKNCAFLIYDCSLMGGAENITKLLCEDLCKIHNIFLISIFQEKKFMSKGYTTYKVDNKTKSITYNCLKYSKKISEILKANKIEILFSVTAGVNSLAALSAFKAKIPWVFIEHSNLKNQTYGKKHYFRQYIGAKFSKRLIVLTEQDRKNYINQFKLPSDRVRVIPNWFVMPKQEAMYDSNSKTIMSAGRLSKIKGYDMLISVAENVFRACPDWKWEIFGDGDEYNMLNIEIINRGLENKLFLMGNVKPLYPKFAGHAFFVMTSYFEGLPLVLLEAQSSLLPIVSFDIQTGPNEIVVDKVNGYLIPSYDVMLMSNMIIKLINERETRQFFSDNSGLKLEKFSKDKILKKWYNLIESL